MLASIAALLVSVQPQPLPPPLLDYLRAAEGHNHSLRLSRAQLAEQQGLLRQSLAGLTPSLALSGGYTRNQYDAVLPFPNSFFGAGRTGTTLITIQPYDQLQGTVGLNIPLVEPAALARYAEGRHGVGAAAQAILASEEDVQLAVGQGYYQVVAAQGVLAAAERALATAVAALEVNRSKFAAGSANRLTVDRAQVDVARSQQTIADAQRVLGLARRNLETLSGSPVAADLPDPGVPALPQQPETAYVQAAEQQRPELAQAREAIAQAAATRDEAWLGFSPNLLGQAQEHFTNYAGFVGSDTFWTLGVLLSWNLDPVGTAGAIKRGSALVVEQEERLAQALDAVRDDVHAAWLQVLAGQAHVLETKAEVQSASEALKLTQEQFGAGTTTALELSQAQRDAFTAEATAAQSAADLASALLALQRATGTALLSADSH